MSDDDENEEQPQFHVFHAGPTREQMDQMMMAMDVNAHASIPFFDELSEEHLLRFRGILSSIRADPSALTYFMGIASSHLKFRFGICMGCGKKHDEELKNLVGDGGPDVAPPSEIDSLPREEYEETCDRYNLDWADDDSGAVRCRGCGTEYVSLADRMKRPADKSGCEGCRTKEKWG